MSKFRTAVIGCGSIAGAHLQVLCTSGYTEVIALCDILPEKSTALAERFLLSVPHFTDYVEMLDVTKPDFVHICTPHYLHAEMAIAALKRDINVYLEKPAAIDEADLSALLQAEKESRGRITVSFQNRTLPEAHRFFELVEENGGALGGRAMVTWHRGKTYYGDDWHGVLSKEGGGVMMNQAIHSLDLLLCAMNGEPLSVRGEIGLYENASFSEVEDNAALLISYPDERRIVFCASNNYPQDAPNYIEVMTKNRKLISLLGKKLLINGDPEPIEEDFLKIDGKPCWGSGHFRCIGEFYHAVRDNLPVPVSLSSATLAVRILLALYRSEGKTVTLPPL